MLRCDIGNYMRMRVPIDLHIYIYTSSLTKQDKHIKYAYQRGRTVPCTVIDLCTRYSHLLLALVVLLHVLKVDYR